MGNGPIFISYRRDDSAGFARAIYDQLVQRFSRERVFMDVDAIEPGVPFDEATQRAVGQSEILLALIGRRWMEPQAGAGPRLNDPDDFVHIEIAAALSRNIRVIPVLLDGTSMPAEEALPEPLRALARRNAVEIRHSRFASDMERLVEAIRTTLGETGAPRTTRDATARKVTPRRLVGGLAVVAVLALLFFTYSTITSRQSPSKQGTEATEPAPALSDVPSTPKTSSSHPSTEARTPPTDLADLAVGTYDGAISADSKGPSMSDVTVMIAKVSKRRVRITSDYARLAPVEVDLTRIGDTILNAGGLVVVVLYLDKQPPVLLYNPGGVAYGGSKR
jgi:hypothetical protein